MEVTSPIRVSVIVPVYNMEKHLRGCLNSLCQQTIPKEEMEVLLVDDGSQDSSIAIMQEYADRFAFFKIVRQENGGAASARNAGIRQAAGKYMLFLDADDMLSPETAKNTADFFDRHYEEIDLVDIPILRREGDEKGKSFHFRYKILKETGVYDLTKPQNFYITQTTVNICVKNLGADNILFDTGLRYHEDQKYCTEVLRRKMKIGYCAEAAYLYLQQSDSTIHSTSYAYYLFEPTMKMWEELFAQYPEGEVPGYIQALYLNDIRWKTKSDILLPYHYSEEALAVAKNRLLRLLNQVEDSVILGHPSMSAYQKQYFIRLKQRKTVHMEAKDGVFHIVENNEAHSVLYSHKTAEFLIHRAKLVSDKLTITATLQSPFFNYMPQPKLFLVPNGKEELQAELPLSESSWKYHDAKLVTNPCWLTDFTVDLNEVTTFRLYAVTGVFRIPLLFKACWQTGMHRTTETFYESISGSRYLCFQDTVFRTRRRTPKDLMRRHVWSARWDRQIWKERQYYMPLLPFTRSCWLYYDCKGVEKDNGYYQFEYDFSRKDGIRRFYVINEDDFERRRSLYPPEQQPYLLQFGSREHKLLYLCAEMIITAYVEPENYSPFRKRELVGFADLRREYDLVYLQHGVLHAHMPWKYSRDRLCLDYEVISTVFEEENLTHHYCFTEEHLIKSGMPRYDFIEPAQPERRILYAPSWRKYLVGREDSQWVTTDDRFLRSDFFRETERFLNSPELAELLETYDYVLDLKLHPIFKRYEHLYRLKNPRVNTASTVDNARYSLFISDNSSFTFDFVYLQTPILYFFPDYEMFRAGMNDYREVDYPLEDGFGPFTETADDLLRELKQLLSRECRMDERYRKKMEGFFFYKDRNQRERIYNKLISIHNEKHGRA
ncbi:MAG: glycosyltransferase [Oscillospiraceae bacterium]|nr:glycosyltransferase [Oscillospiraceae bacterium]